MMHPFSKWQASFAVVVMCFLILGALLIDSALTAQSVRAESSRTSHHLFHPGFGVAVIDGYIEVAEWANADTYTLPMYPDSPESMTGKLYVMQSQTDFYLAFEITDNEMTTTEKNGIYGDTLQFHFDDNDSGTLYEINENKLTLFSSGPLYTDQFYVNNTGSSNYDITQVGGETNGAGMSGRHDGSNHFEVRFPLCSGDFYDFCLAPTDIVGLQIKYFDMFPVDQSVDYDAYFYPAMGTGDLVTIEVQDIRTSYLPLILK